MRLAAFLLAIAFPLSVSRAPAAPLVIVADGQPRARLVTAADDAHAATAAAEIQRYVEKMSGALLPISIEADTTGAKDEIAILIGHTRAAQAAGVKMPSGFDPSIRPDAFGEEGYVLRTRGGRIFIGGNGDGPYQGTLYAAYAFLEKLGCRWYFPGDWGEIVPSQKTVTVPDLDVSSRPDFVIRDIWLSGWIPVTKEEAAAYRAWGTKIGFSGPGFYPTAGDGFLAFLLPPAEYAEKHPEFYAMDKTGKRSPYVNKRTGRFDDRNTMLCLSNPEVFAESVKHLRAFYAGQKNMRGVATNGFGISPPDGAPFCYCTNCTAANQNFNYPAYVHERMQSEEYFGFAVRLAAEFPDKWVATMAYSNREMPPQGVTLPGNLSVKYAPISCCVLHPNDDPRCWRRQEMGAILRQYVRQTPHFQIRDYNPGFLTGVFLPERDMANIAVNVPWYRAAGVRGMYREGRKVFMQTWLSYYLTGKLLWDADADVGALKRDFYETFFGPAAGPHVQAWWDGYEAALGATTVHVHEDWLVNHVVTVELARTLHRHVTAAGQAVMTDAQRGRFAAFALIAAHVEAYAAMHAAERALDYPRAAAAAQRMLDLKNQLNVISPFLYTYNERRETRPSFTLGYKQFYEQAAARTGGAAGELVAPFPLEAKFARDPFNEGVVAEWYAPAFDDTGWGTKDTFYLWEQQDPPEDERGHDWDGYGWYRTVVEVPPRFAGKAVHFFCGGAINEAWVWVNGRYAGHKPHKLWWGRNQEFDFDVTGLVQTGRNTIAIRVLNDTDVGGLYRRGFLWAPAKPAAPAAGGADAGPDREPPD